MDIETAREMLAAASPWPWGYERSPDVGDVVCRETAPDSHDIIAALIQHPRPANGALAALAPATLAALILAVEALEGTDPWVAFGPSKLSGTPGVQCAYCDREFELHEEPQHASDCPWVVALAAWEAL